MDIGSSTIKPEHLKVKPAPAQVMLSEQFDEQERLIDLLYSRVNELGKTLEPILVSEPEGDTATDASSDVGPRLSPLQLRMMGQYYSINNIISRLENIARRVQL